MALTIEELRKTIRSSNHISDPFKMVGYTPTLEEMTNYLDICAFDLKINLKVRGDFRGFPKDYLEKKVVNFATSNKWDS